MLDGFTPEMEALAKKALASQKEPIDIEEWAKKLTDDVKDDFFDKTTIKK